MTNGGNKEESPVPVIGRAISNIRSFRGRRTLVLVFALSVVATLALGGLFASPVQAGTGVTYSLEELSFVWRLNDYRASNGLKPLLLSDTLSLSADRHSSDMGKYRFFDHTTQRSDWFWPGATCFQRMDKVGYAYNTSEGENIAAGQSTAKEVFDDFVASSGHKEVMLYPSFKVVGIAHVYVSGSPYGWYWTVDFGGYVDPSARETGQFQQSDSRITYLGAWSTRWAASASGGSFLYTSSKGAAALISFTGTSVELVAKMGPVYGKALVSLDGGAPVTVDLYSRTDAFKKSAFVRRDLAPGPHTLTVKCMGQKNASSGGYVVDVDALRIVAAPGMPGKLTQAARPKRYQQDSTALSYAGAWSKVSSTSASGGSFNHTNSPGAAVNVSFDGTYLAWIAKKGPGCGKAVVSLDGGKPVAVDLYGAYDKYTQKVYDTGLLEDGTHTLSIYWVGQKNSAASDYRINVDGFDVLGNLTAAPEPGTITWLYEQNDWRITYLGLWSTRWAEAASGGAFYYTSAKGAAAQVNFTGTSVELLSKMGPVYGQALVSLDGGAPVTVDFYSKTDAFKKSVFARTGLAPGPHILTIRCTGGKNASSGGNVVDIDALRITGAMTKALALTRRQEGDAAFFSYTGAWSTGLTWSASGGSFKSVNESGGKVTVTFTGTYLAWLARTTPWYGKAQVSLDGGSPVTVDLYSPTILWKRSVYNTGLLGEGTHTVVIKWLGSKNSGSAGTAVCVDAADMLLTTR
jgi:uncharacterized protein YkwD